MDMVLIQLRGFPPLSNRQFPERFLPIALVNPPSDCPLCPRLVGFLEECRAKEPGWFNAPVPSFGDTNARLLIVGLAPGMKGANRTGRPFTGDFAGDLLFQTLLKFDLAEGIYDARPDDGLTLKDTVITNAVRCLPPQNKPVGAEIKACRSFLVDQIDALTNLRIILALGKIGHDSVVAALGHKMARFRFAHQAQHDVGGGLTLVDSYHCSRYNTNTRRLTTDMFENVFGDIKKLLKD